MKGAHLIRLAVVALVLAAALASASVLAQGNAARTLTIVAMRCPAGYAGETSDGPCDGLPMSGVAFRAGRPFTDFFLTGRTNLAGVVAFAITDLPLHGTVRVIEELPSGTVRFLASCVEESGASLEITYEDIPQNVPPIAVADVTVGDSGDVRCAWYNQMAT